MKLISKNNGLQGINLVRRCLEKIYFRSIILLRFFICVLDACKMRAAMCVFFDRALAKMVNAFEERARGLYG